MLGRLAIAVAVVSSGACSLITDEGERERVVAQIEDGGYPPQAIAVADTVAKGVAFPVSFWSYGNACVEKGDEEVSLLGQTAIVTAYDFHRLGKGVCDDVGLSFEHVVQLRFENVGVGLIVINGRGRQDMPVTFQRVVVVK